MYYHPFEMHSNDDSSDGDYRLNKWCGFTEFTVLEDSAPATQWTGERLLIEYCCGEQSRLGNPRNFVDNACKVIRLTEKDDMRTKKGLQKALKIVKGFKGKHIALWVLFRVLGDRHGST